MAITESIQTTLTSKNPHAPNEALLKGLSPRKGRETIQLTEYSLSLFNLSHFSEGCVPLILLFNLSHFSEGCVPLILPLILRGCPLIFH